MFYDEEIRKKFTPRVIARLVWYASDDAWSLYYGQKNAIRETIRKVHEAYRLAEASYTLAEKSRQLANQAQNSAIQAQVIADRARDIAENANELAQKANEIAARAKQQVQSLVARVSGLSNEVSGLEDIISTIQSRIQEITNRLSEINDTFSEYTTTLSTKATNIVSEISALENLISQMGSKLHELMTQDVGYIVIDMRNAKCGAEKDVRRVAKRFGGKLIPAMAGTTWNLFCARDCVGKMNFLKAAEHFNQSAVYLWDTASALVETINDIAEIHGLASDIAATMKRTVNELVDFLKTITDMIGDIVEGLSGQPVSGVSAQKKAKSPARGVRAKAPKSQAWIPRVYTREEAMRRARPSERPQRPEERFKAI